LLAINGLTMLQKLACAAGAMAAALVLALSPLRAETARLQGVRSWAYQLQDIDPGKIKESPYDLVVIDYGFSRGSSIPREVIDLMRIKPDGSRRTILAYLSIGEAENFRYYWRPSWLRERPEWLEPENPSWPGNFLVQYWHPEWQSLMFGNPDAYLDRIVASGFDGVYLDGIDKFEQWRKRRPSAASDMVDLVAAAAAYARRQRPGFLVVPQNGDELLADARLLPIIDGYAREDLLYSEDEEGVRNSRQSIADSVARLTAVTRAGKPVLVVEYPATRELGAALLREIAGFGFVGYVTDRALKTLSPPLDGCGQPDCSR
jgi:cysteinyl-tRNA synthetase